MKKKYLKHCDICEKKNLNIVFCDIYAKEVVVFRQGRKKRLTEVISIFKVLFIIEKSHI